MRTVEETPQNSFLVYLGHSTALWHMCMHTENVWLNSTGTGCWVELLLRLKLFQILPFAL